MTTNAGFVVSSHFNNTTFGAQLNMKDISEADARRLMSLEHKALGYRPPPGSLAAEAQAAAAKHPNTPAKLPEDKIRDLALKDAQRIKEQRAAAGVDLSTIGEAEARKIMSEEHKSLGHRPPPGSLAAKAQAAAAKHPEGSSGVPPSQALQRAALEDAANLEGAESVAARIDLNYIGAAEARKLMSEEHKALGYRPPPESLAAQAQAAAAKHPNSCAGIDVVTLTKAALEDAKKIEIKRRESGGSATSERPNKSSVTRSHSNSSAGSSSDPADEHAKAALADISARAQSVDAPATEASEAADACAIAAAPASEPVVETKTEAPAKVQTPAEACF